MYEIVDLSERHGEFNQALRSFNISLPEKTVYAYSVKSSPDTFEAIMIFSRVVLDVECFQWQMYYYTHDESEGILRTLWDSFLSKHHVSSCIIEVAPSDKARFESLGFKIFRQNDDFQWEIYFPFGIVYKITDVDTGQFYIGETTSQKSWNKGYKGSGHKWKAHLAKYPDHYYKRAVLKRRF